MYVLIFVLGCVCTHVCMCVCGFDLGSLWWSERALYWIPGTEVTGGCEHSVGIENSTWLLHSQLLNPLSSPYLSFNLELGFYFHS